ncbi:MAG TPA: hypothetical protein PLL06_17975 [Acidobacteriota bacterium]|nr:hypothetical protein [Acidobacteriota bacterium]HMZ81593.1 hypothetical protein [Acidobacteriota bacterium]HNB72577.1 hypothetical protein [Acidobacteriota bacterium]HNC46149.1 hypothetical protein [Acidobacteriota bacterium]HNG95960.1 hypothetical protein [Acidobacteriota bacterium]
MSYSKIELVQGNSGTPGLYLSRNKQELDVGKVVYILFEFL